MASYFHPVSPEGRGITNISLEKLTGDLINRMIPHEIHDAMGQARVAVAAAMVAVLVLVACTGSSAINTSGANPNAESSLQLEDLNSQAVVAAQDRVLIDIYQRALPSVVLIRTTRAIGGAEDSPRAPDIPGIPFDRLPDAPHIPEEFFSRGEGSGFVWDDQGRIVTNHHVIAGADRVTVIFADGIELEATVLGSDPDSDLAVLQVEIPKGFSMVALPLGQSELVRAGQMAVAIGNPFGQEFTITRGIVSAVGRTIRSGNSQFSIPEVIQTDAPINPGNSGGPLLDRRGLVIGVNTQILSRSGSSSGIGFAVPIDAAKRVIPVLIQDGRFEYSWLGISGTTLRPNVAELMDLPQDTRGALVISLAEGGPAEEAGLQGSDRSRIVDGVDFPLGGDIIVAINGESIEDMDGLIAYLIDKTRPGEEATIEVLRGGETRETIKVTLGTRPGL